MINTVSKGEPIRATWANSIALELNHPNGLNLRSKHRAENYSRPMQYASEPAFQIRTTSNYDYTLNTGQIYIDGELVEASENNQDSYNQYGSIDNWEALSIYTPISEKDFPIWTILIYKLAIEEAAVGDEETPPPYKASLSVKSFDGSQSPKTVPTPDNYYLWKSIPVNEVDEEYSELKQLVSGSIYLSTIEQPSIIITDGISIIAGDGINVDYSDNAYTISAKLSIIPTDDVITTHQYTDTDKTIIVELGANLPEIHKQVSIIAGDGIIVDSKEYTDVITYTVSTTFSPINFDEEWFIIEEDGTVTLNEEKLEQEALAIAPNVSSQITTTATAAIDNVTDCGREGDIMLEVVTQGDSATARAWTQW